MISVRNNTELTEAVVEKLQIALNKTMIRLLNDLEDIIDNTVYKGEPEFYDRTYSLKEAFDFYKPYINKNNIYTNIVPKWSAIRGFQHDDDEWQHGNSNYDGSLINTFGEFMDLMNSSSEFGRIAGFHPLRAEKGQFWDEFMEHASKNIDKYFAEECKTLQIDLDMGIRASGLGVRI